MSFWNVDKGINLEYGSVAVNTASRVCVLSMVSMASMVSMVSMIFMVSVFSMVL